MPRDRNTAVFQLMGKGGTLAGDRAVQEAADIPAIVAWEHRLEDAVLFLAESLRKAPRKGKKPVIMHSLRVGSMLMTKGSAPEVVIAGMLHDIMEKAPVTAREISRRFGSAVALIVSATTNQTTIDHPLARYEDSLKRCASLGEGALMVRVADLMDNCDRLTALGQYERLGRLAEKLHMLIAYCRAFGMDQRVTLDLSLRLRRIRRLTGVVAKGAKASRPEAVALKAVKRTKKRLRKGEKSPLPATPSRQKSAAKATLARQRATGRGASGGTSNKKMKKANSKQKIH